LNGYKRRADFLGSFEHPCCRFTLVLFCVVEEMREKRFKPVVLQQEAGNGLEIMESLKQTGSVRRSWSGSSGCYRRSALAQDHKCIYCRIKVESFMIEKELRPLIRRRRGSLYAPIPTPDPRRRSFV